MSFEAIERCEHCHGNGAEPGTPIETCPKCQGTGQLRAVTRTPFGQVVRAAVCDMCDGDGRVPKDPCHVCRGRGRRAQRVKLSVDVPAGIEDGQRIRISGRGHTGEHGGPSGDLYVQIRVKEDPRFVRNGDDLVTVIDVAAPLAALGTTVEVPTIDGAAELEIPPGTQPNETFPIRGEGMPALRGRRHGNLQVVVNVVIPRKLKREQRDLLQQLSDSLTEDNLRTEEGVFGKLQPGLRRLIRLSIQVRRDQAELVLAELLELAPSGVEEVELGPQLIEYAVYGAPGELPELPALQAAAGGALVEIATQEIADDWAERWREFHRPLVLGDRLCVRPPWEPAGQTELDVVIEPGQAFGTGAHATTRLCLELMLDTAAAGRSFVDLGCGSGVLAIVAVRLGFDPVLALDYDEAALSATRDNSQRNGVDFEVRRFDLRTEQVPDCDFLAANVLAGPLRTWAASQRRLPPELILSGLLETEADSIAEAYAAHGRLERERRISGDWAALRLTSPSG